MKEALLFDDLKAETLDMSERGDGQHRVLKVDHGGTPLIIKVYGRKRGRVSTIVREILERSGGIKSSFSIPGRMQTERAVLDLWRREGFDVPKVLYADLLAHNSQPCVVMEWIDGLSMAAVLKSSDTPLTRKQELVERFASVTGKRHARALELQEVRLLTDHPTLSHILVAEDRLVHIDFEIVFTPKKDLERLVRYELGGFLYSLAKVSKMQFPVFLRTFAAAYSSPERMHQVMTKLQKSGTVPIYRWLELVPYYRFFRKYRTMAAVCSSQELLSQPTAAKAGNP